MMSADAAQIAIADPTAVAAAAAVEVELELEREFQIAKPDENAWRTWLVSLFGRYITRGSFAQHHAEFWNWLWSLSPGARPAPYVAIWPRGGAKSTSAELACCAVGARGTRRYALYVSRTQDRADDHVGNIAAMLEQPEFGRHYPGVSDRLVGKFGNSRGWRRDRVRTRSGFTVDALGLDTAARGAKLDEDRPDLIILDDLDDNLDTLATIQRNIATLTHTILPAGAPESVAVLAVQNMIHPDGIFARLSDGRADFLADRIVSGPHPALHNFTYEQDAASGRFIITYGEATWDAMGLEACQALIDRIGLTAFLNECQHEVTVPPGGMYDHIDFRHCTWDNMPALLRVVVWVDPAVTDTDESDAHGIQADGVSEDGTIYRLFSWEDRTSPLDSMKRAIMKAVELKAEAVGVETDQGGDTWQSTYREAARLLGMEDSAPAFRSAKAGAGHGPKAHRQAQQLVDYEKGHIVHVIGTHTVLERALKRFPKTKPFDLADASYWSWYDLASSGGSTASLHDAFAATLRKEDDDDLRERDRRDDEGSREMVF